MRILLSNDDGIFAEGLRNLKEILSDMGEIYIVAPDRERSATGHGITVHSPLKPREVAMEGVCKAWSVDGTPADCVKLGIEALMPDPPDILISGINLGPNLGTDVLYSGTVSAAIEGLINNVPSVAISLTTHAEPNFTNASDFIKEILLKITSNNFPADCLCNINLPNQKKFEGIKITTLCKRRYDNVFHKRYDPRGEPYYWMGGEPQDIETPDTCGHTTDAQAVKEGYISVTPIQIDLTDYNAIEILNKYDLTGK